MTSICVPYINSFKGREETGHSEGRVFLQVAISQKMYENLTAISLKMKRNLTACLITFTLKEFPVHTSKTFSFSRKEALFWHKPRSDVLIAGTADLNICGME